MGFSKASTMKSVMIKLLTEKPEGMTYSEIWNHIVKEAAGITPQTHPRLFTKNGNIKVSCMPADFKGWSRLKYEFLVKFPGQERKHFGGKYRLRHTLTVDQINDMKFWSPKWKEAI